MSIRCALCGSNRVAVDTSNEGFNVGKAFAGTILFGAGGAIMGVNGNKRNYYHCGACGTTLSYSMLENISLDIDRCIANSNGSVYALRAYKKSYPNIEWEENTSTSDDATNCEQFFTDEELADIIYNYCINNNRLYIKVSELEENIRRNEYKNHKFSELDMEFDSSNFFNARRILEKRGLITTATDNDEVFVKVYVNAEEIRANLNDVYIKDTTKNIFLKHRSYCLGVLTSIFNGNKTMLMSKAKELLAIEYYKDNVSDNPMIIEWLANITIAQSNNRICSLKGCGKLGILNFLFNEENNELTEIELLDDTFERISFDEDSKEMVKPVSVYQEKQEVQQAKKPKPINHEQDKLNSEENQRIEQEIIEVLSDGFEWSVVNINNATPFLETLTNQKITSICLEMVKKNLLAMNIVKKKRLFSLPNAIEAREEQIRLETQEHNAKIIKQINALTCEKALQEQIVAENAKKIFGEGAKKKKSAQKRILEIQDEIVALNLQLRI